MTEQDPGDAGFDTPDAAQSAFYAAFDATDAAAMMAVWAGDEDGVECVHPMGERLTTRERIAASWREIFAGGVRLTFTINDVRGFDAADLAVRVVHEDIRFGSRFEQRSRVIATNVYRRTANGWRMVLHHGSPSTPPELTARATGRATPGAEPMGGPGRGALH